MVGMLLHYMVKEAHFVRECTLAVVARKLPIFLVQAYFQVVGVIVQWLTESFAESDYLAICFFTLHGSICLVICFAREFNRIIFNRLTFIILTFNIF